MELTTFGTPKMVKDEDTSWESVKGKGIVTLSSQGVTFSGQAEFRIAKFTNNVIINIDQENINITMFFKIEDFCGNGFKNNISSIEIFNKIEPEIGKKYLDNGNVIVTVEGPGDDNDCSNCAVSNKNCGKFLCYSYKRKDNTSIHFEEAK